MAEETGSNGNNGTTLAQFSEALAQTAAQAGASLVSVDDGSRLTASGVIWTADGVIVATSHGVERDEELAIVTADGTRYPATLIGRDEDTDIAVLKVEATNLPAIARSAGASVGSLALAVGRPGGTDLTATLGVISGRRETETNGQAEYILQTDAVLYPGFSGGVLAEAGTGAFLGLLNRLYGRGMGVALGTPLVARVVDALLAHGRVPRGYLGIRTQLVPLPENWRTGLALPQERGLLIAGIATNSPAEQAGVLLGDILVAIDGQPVQDIDDLRRHLGAGRQVTLSVIRGGALAEVPATVGTEKAS